MSGPRAVGFQPGESGNPAGRPRDWQPDDAAWETLDKLLAIQCTLPEVAAFFGCSEDTVVRRVKERHGTTYQEYAKSIAPRGRVSLRRKQFELALAGDRTMLIWLGKQMLGQADKVDQRISGPDGKPIEVADVTAPVAHVLGALAKIAARRQMGVDRANEVDAGDDSPAALQARATLALISSQAEAAKNDPTEG